MNAISSVTRLLERVRIDVAALWERILIRVAVFAAAFTAINWAFEWRNCALSKARPDSTSLFVPLDARIEWYGRELAQKTLGTLPEDGRLLYGISQLTLDIAFPVLYAIAFYWALRAVLPRSHWLWPAAGILPIGAATFDGFENVLTASMAFSGSYTSWLAPTAGFFTFGKWLIVYATLATLIVAFVWFQRSTAAELLRYLFFVRVPLLLGLLVIGLSWMGRRQSCEHPAAPPVGLPTVQNLLYLDNAAQLGYAVLCLFVACAVIVFCGTHLWRLAEPRIGLKTMGLTPQAPDTWPSRILFGASAFALALPLLVRLRSDESVLHGLMAGTLGLGAGIATLFLVLVIRRTVLGEYETRLSQTMLAPLRKAATVSVEARLIRFARKWLGPGYENLDRAGQLYRGHALAIAVMFALGVGYAAGSLVLNPARALPTLFNVPPIGYVMLLTAFLCMLFSNLTFIFDHLRVPVLLLFVAWIALWGNLPRALPAVWYDTQHYFDVTFVQEGLNGPPTVEQAFKKRADRAGPGPIVVVAAAGGGIQASAWTAMVLEGLYKALGDQFTNSIYFISSTSGGSVGTYFFLEALRSGGQSVDQVSKAAMASSLEASAWGLVFPDLQRLVTPFLVWDVPEKTRLDRAWAIEQAWHRWRNCMTLGGTGPGEDMEENPACRKSLAEGPPPVRLSDWWRAAGQGTLPGIVFNATVINDGEQFLASNLDLRAFDLQQDSHGRFAETGMWTYGAFDPTLCGHYPRVTEKDEVEACRPPANFVDMQAVTAARISAAFPYVTPVARARVHSDGASPASRNETADKLPKAWGWQIADGGYFDNPGTVAVLRWIEAIEQTKRRHPKVMDAPILLIQINPFPPAPEIREAPPEGQGWKSSLFGPLQAIVNVRTSSQLARNDLELTLLSKALKDTAAGHKHGRFEAVEFRPPLVANRSDPPLSWELSTEDKQSLRRDWEDPHNQEIVTHLKRHYFSRK